MIAATPELVVLERLLDGASRHGEVSVLVHAEGAGLRLPVHALRFGTDAPDAPALIVVGGVHGLERIGTEVVLAFLTTFLAQLAWDEVLGEALRRCRVCFVPLVNPVGLALRRRANGRGVDLMRNAPPHPETVATPWVGGQRVSPRLPWFGGHAGAPMEPEAAALLRFVDAQTRASPLALALDVHSGFGMVDRLWFPWARTRRPLPHLAEIYAFKQLLDQTLPNHVYHLEPTARVYTIDGDLWDHAYDTRAARGGGALLPLTLELGSWLWVKKNPRQVLSLLGGFNPIKAHRLRRTLRRHLPLFDLLLRATVSVRAWAFPDPARRAALDAAGFAAWFAAGSR